MFVHIIDGGIGGSYVAHQLMEAGFKCRVHSPNNNRVRAVHAPYPSLSMGHTEQEIEKHIGNVLGTFRGLFLISSYVGSLIANQMIDQCGQSGNIITCDDLKCGSIPVVASSISVNVYKKQRQLARISHRLKHFDIDHEFIVADKAVRFAAGSEYDEHDARKEFNNNAKFLSSPSMIVAAHKLGVKNSMYHNYAGLVREFLEKRQ
ncbi:hypothetical protein pEaSNUABM28_00019 [Erwinia phage pEa_SNUABM_28]|uniref:Uncharacterized protein n=1 Tax=Erwinia phage pEa_SNUABM_16 TaxID=2869544 RepID=A0AAE8XTP5_9CAUD|nr:hypothetical protein MPK64_gp019 [Erwinia phage pEa_SNUABM_16]QZE58576.1 hypothetical protein pEaSNUABM28_00019 [Erwinia phage pEa_SNUABM_28]QZE58922.1 hypothetical protein pEaSNUABM18_00019 [Erwinia phage pEa_SNUABM_18]UAW96163.1 hypothetical protein pEaSNUABM16_00019 [Erwinia phage pEa_SNUABM_16]